MFVHCKYGQTHFLCYLLDRFSEHAALNESVAALRRQGFQYRLQMPQLVARMQRGFGGMIGMQDVEFSHKLQRDDLFAAGLIDQKVAGDLKQIGFA